MVVSGGGHAAPLLHDADLAGEFTPPHRQPSKTTADIVNPPVAAMDRGDGFNLLGSDFVSSTGIKRQRSVVIVVVANARNLRFYVGDEAGPRI